MAMSVSTKTAVRRLLQATAAVLSVAIVFDSARLWQDAAVNRRIARDAAQADAAVEAALAAGAAGAAAPAGARKDGLSPGADRKDPGEGAGGKADARELIAAAKLADAAGDLTTAASLLRGAADRGSPELRAIALYDLGNVYLRAALRPRAEGAPAAMPLFELAKDSFRSALYAQPDLWDAKFNLELTLRALPDSETDDADAGPNPRSERAVTTMRGFTLGLP
jgi:mxaK protein